MQTPEGPVGVGNAPIESNRLERILFDALQVLDKSYSDLKQRKKKSPYIRPKGSKKWHLENEITEDLVEIAETKRRLTYEWDNESKNLKNDSRIDITIIHELGVGFERRLCIECKRLNKIQKNNQYIRDGIVRFIKGKYSKQLPIAGMVGYVEEGKISNIVEDLNNRLENKSSTIKKLNCCKNKTNLNNSYDSCHERKDNSSITIFHLMLTFNVLIGN